MSLVAHGEPVAVTVHGPELQDQRALLPAAVVLLESPRVHVGVNCVHSLRKLRHRLTVGVPCVRQVKRKATSSVEHPTDVEAVHGVPSARDRGHDVKIPQLVFRAAHLPVSGRHAVCTVVVAVHDRLGDHAGAAADRRNSDGDRRGCQSCRRRYASTLVSKVDKGAAIHVSISVYLPPPSAISSSVVAPALSGVQQCTAAVDVPPQACLLSVGALLYV
eukprot:COSAG02_NODE_594_length_19849_cov_323.373114_11_plen_218_part_00